MTNPVPGYSVSTAYRKTGSMWTGCGWHTGQDYAAPYGTPVVAARAGTVVHVDMGSSFGSHQFVIRPGDGTQDFYAHCGSRPADGARVELGTTVAIVDAEGNATGPHLHFERHSVVSDSWPACSQLVDPMASHNAGSSTPPAPAGGTVYLSKLRYGQYDSDSVRRLQEVLNGHSIPGGQTLPVTGNYLDETDEEVRLCQRHHIPPEDPPQGSYVGEQQASHLFAGTGLTVLP